MSRRLVADGWLFKVEGNAEFPLDMLRVDACYPLSEADSYAIAQSVREGRREGKGVFRIALRSHAASYTPGRWLSFGWKVVS
jgi:hypothetical protein